MSTTPEPFEDFLYGFRGILNEPQRALFLKEHKKHLRAGSGEHSDQGVRHGPEARDIIGENIRNGITADGSHYTCFQKPDMAQYEVYPDGTVVVLIKQNDVRHLFEIPPTPSSTDEAVQNH